MPKPGDYVLMSLNKVFTAWGKQKMQLGDVYKVTCSAPGEEFEWVPYTEKIIKAKGISLADVLEWSKADGQSLHNHYCPVNNLVLPMSYHINYSVLPSKPYCPISPLLFCTAQ